MATEEAKKEVVKKQENAVAKTGGQAHGGLEHESIGDLDLPRVILLQPTSPQVVEKDSALKAGQVIDSYFSKPLPEIFVPICVSKRWVKYRARDAGGGIEWQTRDPFDKRVEAEGKWKDGKPPAATEIWDYFVFLEGRLDLPTIFSFSKTSYAAGRRLYSLFKFSKEDMWNRRYKWGTRMQQKKEKGQTMTYYVFSIDPAGESTKQERHEAAHWYGILESNKHKVEVAPEGESEEEAGGEGLTPDWAKEDAKDETAK